MDKVMEKFKDHDEVFENMVALLTHMAPEQNSQHTATSQTITSSQTIASNQTIASFQTTPKTPKGQSTPKSPTTPVSRSHRNAELELIKNKFPITSSEELTKLEMSLHEFNMVEYISVVKNILGANLDGNFEKVLSREICLAYNLSGRCGKKGLNKTPTVLCMLLAAMDDFKPSPKQELKRILQLMKTRDYWRSKRPLKSSQNHFPHI